MVRSSNIESGQKSGCCDMRLFYDLLLQFDFDVWVRQMCPDKLNGFDPVWHVGVELIQTFF